MSSVGRAPLRAFAHRRAPRCPLAVPVRVTLVRAGAVQSVTGRALNLGEGGIAISLADEVRVSDPLAVEFLLPDLGLGLQARAIVRYRGATQSGLEFRSLTRHQQAVIREWTRQQQSHPDSNAVRPAEKAETRISRYFPEGTVTMLRRLVWPLVALLALITLIVWWKWESAWRELEDQARPSATLLVPVTGKLQCYLPPVRSPNDSQPSSD